MAFLLAPILAAAIPFAPTRTTTQKTNPTATPADRAIPPPQVTSTITQSRRSTTVTITIRTDIRISSSEEEKPTKSTSLESESSTPSSLPLKPSSRFNILEASITQDSSTTSTAAASEPSHTGAHVTTFGLGGTGQLVHSGLLTGMAISTDGSTFRALATSAPKTVTARTGSSHPLSKAAIIGIAAGTFAVLASLIAVIFCYSYKKGFKKKKKKKKRDGNTSADMDEGDTGRRRMGQSSQVREMKASYPFTPIYERSATVAIHGLQNTAPWNKPKDVTSHSFPNAGASLTSSTSDAISPYGNYTPTVSDYTIGKNSSLTSDSDLYAPPSALRARYQQVEAGRQAGKLLTSTPYSQNPPQLPTPVLSTVQSSFSHELEPIITKMPTAQATGVRESIWDDDISIVEPHIDVKRDAYPGQSGAREEPEGSDWGPSAEQLGGRKPSSILSDLQQSSAWRNAAPNKLSIASSHPSLHIPESGNWRQNDRKNSVQRTTMGAGASALSRQDSDPRDELQLRREEINGLRVSTLLEYHRWENARKLFSGEGS
ncbi:hypothetical protein HOY82DRAFT_540203 [Tuber indicum]|nr:hypothetical protein HOY82DRAFT_540203 [Tuber indicum]